VNDTLSYSGGSTVCILSRRQVVSTVRQAYYCRDTDGYGYLLVLLAFTNYKLTYTPGGSFALSTFQSNNVAPALNSYVTAITPTAAPTSKPTTMPTSKPTGKPTTSPTL
jgi:hypothetical protein